MQRVLHWADGPMLGQLPHEMSDQEVENGGVFVSADLPCGRYIHEYQIVFSMLVGGEMILRHVASLRVGNRTIKR